MRSMHRIPLRDIAAQLGRTETACKNHFDKIMKLRKKMGTWKGLDT